MVIFILQRFPVTTGMLMHSQDAENRWSMGPIYNMQNLHLLTHMFIHEYKSIVNPENKIDFAQQPTKEARPK